MYKKFFLILFFIGFLDAMDQLKKLHDLFELPYDIIREKDGAECSFMLYSDYTLKTFEEAEVFIRNLKSFVKNNSFTQKQYTKFVRLVWLEEFLKKQWLSKKLSPGSESIDL